MRTKLFESLTLMSGLLVAMTGPAAFAERVPAGAVVKVELAQSLSSKTAQVGGRVTVRVLDGYGNSIQPGSVMAGRVTEVRRATKTSPGVIDVGFRTLEGGASWVPITAELSSLSTKGAASDGSGRLEGRAVKGAGTKFIGYGAAGGAVLGSVLGRKNVLKSGLFGAAIGAAAGYVYGATQKGKRGYREVDLKAGDTFGVRFSRAVNTAAAYSDSGRSAHTASLPGQR
ncbi:MAG TPA: hypothetical protein VGN26_02875 [Armatimonadota bacterium]|jgi:hypothetical protein